MTKPRLRANGQGTVYPETSHGLRRWRAVLVVGWTIDGRPVRRSRSASSEPAAKDILAQMVKAHEAGDPLPDDRLTVRRWLVRWLDLVAPHVRATTLRTYRFAVERFLLPQLGAMPLRRLRASHVTAMLDAMAAFSPHTVNGVRSVLRRALADAERDRIIDHNPAGLAHGRGVLPPLQAPSTDRVRLVLDELRGHRLSALFVLAAHTGLRIGEASGLRWSDIEGETLRVRVQLQATRDPAEPFVLTAPKTARSAREIILAPAALSALDHHRARQAAERLAAGKGWRNVSGLVFTTERGDPLHPNTIRYVLAAAQEAAGVPRFPFHSFRRFAATIVGATGDMKAAQGLLGHRSETLTADVYASTTDASRRRAAAAMEEALS